mmetsp:Transcript_16978/g.49482  ORF Transcript_16978/g.49482 Transcript_16978/m.49482 type:complete len:217 (-) Transcript_16978:142-792(-)
MGHSPASGAAQDLSFAAVLLSHIECGIQSQGRPRLRWNERPQGPGHRHAQILRRPWLCRGPGRRDWCRTWGQHRARGLAPQAEPGPLQHIIRGYAPALRPACQQTRRTPHCKPGQAQGRPFRLYVHRPHRCGRDLQPACLADVPGRAHEQAQAHGSHGPGQGPHPRVPQQRTRGAGSQHARRSGQIHCGGHGDTDQAAQPQGPGLPGRARQVRSQA